MRKKLLFILGLILVAAGAASAQTKAARTITNDDLEKFRQSRLQAEKDLRENYAKLGFPSPEEMRQTEEQASAERERLSEKLRSERLAREQIQLEQDYLRAQTSTANVVYIQETSGGYYRPVYFGAYYHRYYGSGGYLPGGGYFGPTFNPNQGVQINTTPIRINTTGPTRRPVRIRPPRN